MNVDLPKQDWIIIVNSLDLTADIFEERKDYINLHRILTFQLELLNKLTLADEISQLVKK